MAKVLLCGRRPPNLSHFVCLACVRMALLLYREWLFNSCTLFPLEALNPGESGTHLPIVSMAMLIYPGPPCVNEEVDSRPLLPLGRFQSRSDRGSFPMWGV